MNITPEIIEEFKNIGVGEIIPAPLELLEIVCISSY
jgi:hypothetical protein